LAGTKELLTFLHRRDLFLEEENSLEAENIAEELTHLIGGRNRSEGLDNDELEETL
jgi:hypothetical protein